MGATYYWKPTTTFFSLPIKSTAYSRFLAFAVKAKNDAASSLNYDTYIFYDPLNDNCFAFDDDSTATTSLITSYVSTAGNEASTYYSV
jgi:hypothetical protein